MIYLPLALDNGSTNRKNGKDLFKKVIKRPQCNRRPCSTRRAAPRSARPTVTLLHVSSPFYIPFLRPWLRVAVATAFTRAKLHELATARKPLAIKQPRQQARIGESKAKKKQDQRSTPQGAESMRRSPSSNTRNPSEGCKLAR